MKQKKTIFLVIVLILFPFVTELCTASWNSMVLHPNDRGIKTIDLENEVQVSEVVNDNDQVEKVYSFQNVDRYIYKLSLKLQTHQVPEFKINIKYLNVYDSAEETSGTYRLIKEQDQTTILLDKKVESFEIVVTDQDFSLSEVKLINVITFNPYRFALYAVISLFIGGCWYLYKKDKFHLEHVFLALILMVGSLMIAMLPKVGHWGMDSEIHFKNAYVNSFLGGGYDNTRSYNIAIELPLITMPSTLEDGEVIASILNAEQNEAVVSTTPKSLLPAYNELAYAPYSIGIAVGRILHLSFTVCFMLGKFINLLVYAALGFFTIKLTTKGKRLFFVLLLIPSMLYSVAQYSLDGILYGCMMLSFALFFQQYFDKTKKITFGWTMAFVIATCLAGFAKAVYCLVVLLPLLFSKEKFCNKKQMIAYKFCLGMIALLLLSAMVLPLLTGNTGPSDLRGGLTSASEQLKSLLTHPISFVDQFAKILFNSLNTNLLNPQTFGQFGYIDVLNRNVILINTLLVLFLSITDWNISKKIPVKHKVFWFMMLSALVLMIHGAMYLSFTPVGLSYINGVQPRYFIQILPLLLILPANTAIKHTFNNKKLNVCVVSIVAAISFISVYTLILTVFCN